MTHSQLPESLKIAVEKYPLSAVTRELLCAHFGEIVPEFSSGEELESYVAGKRSVQAKTPSKSPDPDEEFELNLTRRMDVSGTCRFTATREDTATVSVPAHVIAGASRSEIMDWINENIDIDWDCGELEDVDTGNYYESDEYTDTERVNDDDAFGRASVGAQYIMDSIPEEE